jgi:hypothetical protein
LSKRKAVVFKSPQDNPLLRHKSQDEASATVASTSNPASEQAPAINDTQAGVQGSASGRQFASLNLTPKSQPDLLKPNTAFLYKVHRSFEGSESCKKAIATVSKYAFSDIQVLSCKGKIYQFSGLRKGKLFSIKVNPASWELTEVARLLPSASLLQPGSVEWE